MKKVTVEEFKKLLTNDDINKDELVEAFVQNTEYSISEYGKKDSEVLKYKTALKELGRKEGESLDEFKTRLANTKQKVEGDKLTIATLSEQLDEMKRDIATEKAAAQAAIDRANRNKLKAELTNAIGDKVYGSKFVIDSMINNGEVAVVNDKVVFKQGEDIVTFDKGIETFLSNNEDIKKLNQKQGSGDSKPKVFGDKNIEDVSVDEALANITELKKEYGLN